MKLARLFRRIRTFTGLSPGDTWYGLHSPSQLRRILERERARVYRTGERLSFVTFAPRSAEVERATPVWLAKILRARLRSTDEVGCLDERQVGAVLPGTPATGAWKLADDVCLEFPADIPPPICTVYSHPLDWPDGPTDVDPAPAVSADPLDKRTLSLELLFLQSLPLWKRAIDVVGATVGLVVLLPVFAVVAAAVKLTSPGPAFFRQWRTGWGGRRFRICKFRTMVADAEARKVDLLARNELDGPAFKVRHDPRVTAVGRFLRTTSLDELPQLWNVLVGDMSLVGPRPLPCDEADACAAWHRQRLDVVPGLTGIWQVKGRSTVSFADWVRMDLQYIRALSPWQDLKLLLLTVPAVVLRKGAH